MEKLTHLDRQWTVRKTETEKETKTETDRWVEGPTDQ
jgi:hypothetical protein